MSETLTRRPTGPLAAFASRLWAFDSRSAPASPRGGLERVVPTGAMHLVIRLSSAPLVLCADERGRDPRTVGTAVVGGPRAAYYVRDVSQPSCSVGAQLRPGAAQALFGSPASELAEAHTPLDALWGADVESLRDRLASAGSLSAALATFEAELTARVLDRPSQPPMIGLAVRRLAADPRVPIATLVRESGHSHRRFLDLFRASAGLTPATLRRVLRADRALAMLGGDGALGEVALRAGYADQAHCTRELVEIAGVTPGEYRRLGAPSRHVPIAAPRA